MSKKTWYHITDEERRFISEESRLIIEEKLKQFLNDPELTHVSFPPSFSNMDRKLVHNLANEYGWFHKSSGKEPNRIITIFKSDKDKTSTATFFTLSQKTYDTMNKLLATHPVSYAETPTPVAKAVKRKPGASQLSGGRLLIPQTDFDRTHAFRIQLPIYHKAGEIIRKIEDNRVTLVVGETGSGKTTQVPQIILEHYESVGKKCHVICSMPRRVAAVTISERVAYERGEEIGDTVGYQIRLESRISEKTILRYCTNGVFLRSLLSGDQWLNNVSHVILDEVHERDKLTDFTLIVLKDALVKYKNLKLILMSATIDREKFEDYFRNCPGLGNVCGIIEVPGEMYEVKIIHLEHILEGSLYISEKMRLVVDTKNFERTLQGIESLDLSLKRSSERAPVLSCQQQIALLNPDLKRMMDQTLDFAWENGTAESLKLLINFMEENKIPVDYQHSCSGITALMAAVKHSDIDAVDDLTLMNPDLSIQSHEGKTAVMYGEQVGDEDILQFLDSYEAYCDSKSSHQTSSEMSSDVREVVEIYEKCHIGQDIDDDLIVSILASIHEDGMEGAVLVFLPGYEHIMSVRYKILENKSTFDRKGPLDIHILHSRMKSADQKKVFKPPPFGHRKIILSTNIAETSVTINDVVFVIDCGKVKEMNYNSSIGVHTLECNWISQSCARQRRGRAGRTKDGVCFRLYTKERYKNFKPYKMPELLRESIADLCLQSKQLARSGTIAEFLEKAIDPPVPDVLKNTIFLLKRMEALGPDEELTDLGHHLLNLPVDPSYGKMIVYAIILKCLDPILTIVCCQSSGDMFKLPTEPKANAEVMKKRLAWAQQSFSDHMVYLQAFREWQAARNKHRWCQENFVSAAAMEMVVGLKQQIRSQLRCNLEDVDQNSGNWAVVKGAITAGLYPNIAKLEGEKKKGFLSTPSEMKVMLHSSSVVKHGDNDLEGENRRVSQLSIPSKWVIFQESHKIRVFSHLRICTVVSPITVFLCAGPSRLPLTTDSGVNSNQEKLQKGLTKQTGYGFSNKEVVRLDGFINFNIQPETAHIIHDFRIKWNSLVSSRLKNLAQPPLLENEKTLQAVVSVLDIEDSNIGLRNPFIKDRRENVFQNKGSSISSRGYAFQQRGSSRVKQAFERDGSYWRQRTFPLREGRGTPNQGLVWNRGVYPNNQRAFGRGRGTPNQGLVGNPGVYPNNQRAFGRGRGTPNQRLVSNRGVYPNNQRAFGRGRGSETFNQGLDCEQSVYPNNNQALRTRGNYFRPNMRKRRARSHF